jgi:TolA-binding protein
MDREVVVCVGSDSELVLSALGAHQRVELRRGRAAARLSTQPQGSDFGVLTHAGEAIAVGTAFAVEVPLEGSAHGGTRLRVLHGTVRAVTTERQLLVAQEQQLDFTTHALSALDSDAAERDRALLSATQLWARGAENRLVLSTDPPKATVMLDNVLLGQTPLSVDVQPGRHEIDVRAAGFGGVVRRLSFAGAPINEHIVLTPEPQLAAKAANAEAAPTSETTPNASTLARTATGLLEQARTARQTSRFSEAASSYRELLQRHPGSAEAGAALLSLAELELTQLGNPSQALGLYSKYLQRGGNLMQEAQYGHLRALRALGRGAEEQREIAAFLRKYPDSAYAAALKRRLPAP